MANEPSLKATEDLPRVIEFPIEDAFIARYKPRKTGSKMKTVAVSIPLPFITRLSRLEGIELEAYLGVAKVSVYYHADNQLLMVFNVPGEAVNGKD